MANKGAIHNSRKTGRCDGDFARKTAQTIPKTANGQGHGPVPNPRGKTDACVDAAVVTLTLKFEAVLALTDSVAGTEQVAFMGVPVQLSEVVPPIPPPPIESVYVALEPAITFTELELPEATLSASVGLPPVPVSVTFCGLSGALSVNVRAPDVTPAAVGLKVTLTAHDWPAPTELPHVFVSEKAPVA
jgi:hypothetical protein